MGSKISKNKVNKKEKIIIIDNPSSIPMGISYRVNKNYKSIIIDFVGYINENKINEEIHISNSVFLTLDMVKDMNMKLNNIIESFNKKS